MKLRDQKTEHGCAPMNVSNDGGSDRVGLRERAAALLAAADAAIDRALSRNSAEFLAQNRQSGGQ